MADDPVIIYPKWQTELMAALAETNPNNLLERVKEAEKAIAKRFGRISRSTSHAAEIEAIEKAMDALEVLTRKASQPKAS
jgi:5,10-methenyltetrahydromethanopterin hydrogenase